MDKVTAYIKENWEKTFHQPGELTGKVRIKHPYVSPCATEHYTDLYYWDTYFINIGLMLDAYLEQARNNIDNIATFIDELGFMPNANIILDRSQPPLFTAMVYDYWKFTGDISIVSAYIGSISREYEFWRTKRRNSLGLSFYATHGSKEEVLANYRAHHCRVLESSEDEEGQYRIGWDIMAIAESGLDFNMRFRTEESKISAHKFAHLDLDCILFDAERKIAEMMEALNRPDEAKAFLDKANERRKLIDAYYRTEEGIYLDYNMESGAHSEILSAVSFYPYAFGVSSDKAGALKVLRRLELPFGLPACEKREDEVFFQWDYPLMWPAATCLCYMGLRKIGLKEEAAAIAGKYVSAVRSTFEATGRLWEKYDATTGGVGSSFEYATMPMMGWTAGVYRYFVESEKL